MRPLYIVYLQEKIMPVYNRSSVESVYTSVQTCLLIGGMTTNIQMYE